MLWMMVLIPIYGLTHFSTTLPKIVYGDSKSELDIIEFASMDCSACTYFKQKVFPEIQSTYIASNKIRWVRVLFPMDLGDVMMLAYMKHIPQSEYTRVENWYQGFRQKHTFKDEDNLHKALRAGLERLYPSLKKIEEIQPEDMDGIMQETIRITEAYGLTYYPTFLVKGKLLDSHQLKTFLKERKFRVSLDSVQKTTN